MSASTRYLVLLAYAESGGLGEHVYMRRLASAFTAWHSQCIDVDEASDQTLHLYFRWISQHGSLKVTFGHALKEPKSHVLAHNG